MSEQQFTQQDIATTVAETLNMFSTQAVDHALVLIPNPETPGNPAVVITARDGSRYGLEVCPIPEPHVFPTGTIRSMTTEVPTEPEQPQDPSEVTAPTEEPPVPQEPPYVGPDDPQPFEPGPELPQSVRGVDGAETGA